jgi:hypothetical protein
MKTPAPKKAKIDLDRLDGLSGPQIAALHRSLFGSAPLAGNTGHARRRIAWHLQADRGGGLPESARAHARSIARPATARFRSPARLAAHPNSSSVTSLLHPGHDSRLPMPGSLLSKIYRGRTHRVAVLDSGFEYDGRRFRSLSAVACAITGAKWNGFTFFDLGDRRSK